MIDKKTIKSRLKESKKKSLSFLRPEGGGYAWQDTEGVLELLNYILKDAPQEIWPLDEDEYTIIKDGNWRLDLMWTDGCRAANLMYIKDDHTAWVIENKKNLGEFIDFDIGGS